jgi:hypothetical protein
MEQLILNIKNKNKLPFLRELLKRMEFVEIVEPKKLSTKEKKILDDLEESVDFVNKFKKGKTKAKSINQLLDEL